MEYNEFKNLITLESIKDGSIKYKDIIEKINNLEQNVYITYINTYLQNMSHYSRVPLAYFEMYYIESYTRLKLLFEYLIYVDDETLLDIMKCIIYGFRTTLIKDEDCLYSSKNFLYKENTHKLNKKTKHLFQQIYNCVNSKSFDANLSLIFNHYANEEKNDNILLWMKNAYIIASLAKMNGFKSPNVLKTLIDVLQESTKSNDRSRAFLLELKKSLMEQDKKRYGKIFMEITLK